MDAAFVQGGLELPQDENLQSLGAIFLELMVVFRGKSSPVGANAGEWGDILLAAGSKASGNRAAALALIEAAGLQNVGIDLGDVGGNDAIDALHAN